MSLGRYARARASRFRIGRGTIILVALAASVSVLAGINFAMAVAVMVDSVNLTGGGSTWDAEAGFGYSDIVGAPCTLPSPSPGFTPVIDGMRTYGNAFDAGLYLNVGGVLFDDETGDLAGQTLKTGPMVINGLPVSRTDAALQTSSTLRTLIKLRNPSNTGVTQNVKWDSAMGRGGDGETQTSSNGDALFTKADRWATASDPVSATDPTLTFVLYGKGKSVTKTANIVEAPEDTPVPDLDCVVASFNPRIPAGKTRYLLFFTEMNDNDAAATAAVGKFNVKGLNNQLLSGIGPKIRSRILNWHLA